MSEDDIDPGKNQCDSTEPENSAPPPPPPFQPDYDLIGYREERSRWPGERKARKRV